MPSQSGKQHRFMEAIKHGWKPSRMKHPPSREVAEEFVDADKEVGKFQRDVKARSAKVKGRRRR